MGKEIKKKKDMKKKRDDDFHKSRRMQKVGSRDRQVNAAGLKGSMYVHPIIIKKALKLTQKPLQGLKLQIFFTPF